MPKVKELIAKFGGEANLARILGTSEDTVKRWGKTGAVPTRWRDALVRLSASNRVPLSTWDLFGHIGGIRGIVSAPLAQMCLDRPAASPTSLPPRSVPAGPPQISADGSVVGVARQPLAGETEKMWDAWHVLRVKMMGGTAFIQSKVRQYAQEWANYANLGFDFVNPSQSAEIKISFDPGGSWSAVGRDALSYPFDFATMNFGWFTDTTPDQEFSRVVLHEFGHALGLIHEHQSPVAGIQWDKEKTYAHYKASQGWDRATVDREVFAKYAISTTNYSVYDPTSIMHYWVDPSLTLDGTGAPTNTRLSTIDKSQIASWYSRPISPSTSEGLLRTGDDCDEIEFKVEYGVVAATDVEFQLAAVPDIWWKQIEVPVSSSAYRSLQIPDGNSPPQTMTVARADLDTARRMRFWKAKRWGFHTLLGYTWNVIFALPGGARVSLNWRRDSC